MTVKRHLAWLACTAGVLVAAAAIAFTTFDGLINAIDARKSTAVLGLGGPFTLTDQEGRIVTDADFRGKWLLLYFGYTRCPDACPTALNSIAEALDQLGSTRDKIQPVFVTLDPERDTPDVLKDYTSAFRAGILGLTGSPAQIAAVAKEYRITYQKHMEPQGGDYTVDHTSIIFLIDPKGRPASLFSHETPPERLARDIKAAMG
jgi:protein SCO1